MILNERYKMKDIEKLADEINKSITGKIKMGGRIMGSREPYACSLCRDIVEHDPVFYDITRKEFIVYNITCTECGTSNQIKSKGMGIEIVKNCSCESVFIDPLVIENLKSASHHKKTYLTLCSKCAGEDIDRFFTIKKI